MTFYARRRRFVKWWYRSRGLQLRGLRYVRESELRMLGHATDGGMSREDAVRLMVDCRREMRAKGLLDYRGAMLRVSVIAVTIAFAAAIGVLSSVALPGPWVFAGPIASGFLMPHVVRWLGGYHRGS